MANPTAVNSQVTDSVTQSLLLALGDAGTSAVSNTRQVACHALGLLMENATAAQQRGQTVADAVVTAGVRLIGNPETADGSTRA